MCRKTSERQFTDFWRAQTHFLARLYRTPLVTFAAIKGACPAGGCILSMACDYRFMTEEGYIGLNEVKIGVPVPRTWCKIMERLVGGRAGHMLLTGVMCKPKQALQIGLVDKVHNTWCMGMLAWKLGFLI